MSVVLENVTKIVTVLGAPSKLFDGLNLEIDRGMRIGVLALPKTGKTTLLKLVCGTDRQFEGKIRRGMNISWPIPNTDFLAPASSLAWNIRWLARAYGVKDPDFARTVAKIGAFEDYVNGPLAKAPQSVRPQLGFAVGIAMDFDLYLFDQQAVPQIKEYKDAGLVHLKERTAGKAILVATSLPQMVLDCCEQAFVLERGRLTPFADLKEGVDYFKAMQKADADKQKEAAANKKADDGEGESVSDENEKGVELVQAAIGDII